MVVGKLHLVEFVILPLSGKQLFMDADALLEHERIMKLRQSVLYKNVTGQPAHTSLNK